MRTWAINEAPLYKLQQKRGVINGFLTSTSVCKELKEREVQR